MKNMLWYLGFLAALSLLYFVDGKIAFLGFLGFIPYFSLFNISDERVEMVVGKATRNAFMYTIVFGVAALSYMYLTGNSGLFPVAFVGVFGGALLICLLSAFYYNQAGK